jgi:isoleucyl-tRNA synthetase
LQKNDLVKSALKEIDKIKFIPDWGRTRFYSFVSNRTEWCISRQRIWGVPIPAILCKKCDHVYLTSDFVEKIAAGVEKEGVEFWDKISIKQMLDDGTISKDFKCKNCGNADLDEFKKETDILDVWLESGVSHYAVLIKDKKNLGIPADMYLEGSDQHRGWFQSSLLSSMVLNDQTCTKQIVTHGFILDEKGRKMSKSLGNVIAPNEVIEKYSRDIIRLWVASSDYHGDIAISEIILKNCSEVYRKIRNTCRFLISNLYDFDIKKDAIAFEKLLTIDQYALANLYELNSKIIADYKECNFAAVYHALNNYCANDLSSLYLDVCKDRLYVEKPDGHLRRSAQTAMYNILDTITHLMAPMLSFLAEEVSSFYQKEKKESIHLQQFVDVVDIWNQQGKTSLLAFEKALQPYRTESPDKATYAVRMRGVWNVLEQLREVILKAIEEKRTAEVVKHSLEVKVQLYLDPKSEQKNAIDEFCKILKESKEDVAKFFKDWLIVSQFEFVENENGLSKTDCDWIFVSVEHADGVKCPRCWQWEETEHETGLCARCRRVLEK